MINDLVGRKVCRLGPGPRSEREPPQASCATRTRKTYLKDVLDPDIRNVQRAETRMVCQGESLCVREKKSKVYIY